MRTKSGQMAQNLAKPQVMYEPERGELNLMPEGHHHYMLSRMLLAL